MPVATVTNEALRYDLKSLPPANGEEGGYIMARPLPYGMKLARRDKATRMRMEQEMPTGNRAQRRAAAKEQQTQKIELDMQSEWAAQHDFAYCIVEHNLTDVNGTLLDFTKPMAFKSLNPKVGEEIERILSDINDEEDDEETLETFTKLSSSSSTEEKMP